MFAIISIFLIASTAALNLPPASISAPVSRDFHYQIADGETSQSLTNKISNIQPVLGFQDQKYLKQIGGDLKFHIDAMQSTPYKFPQILKINKKLGVLRLLQITATVQVNTKTMTINGKYVEITQNIPPVFNKTKVCEKGRRNYSLFGQRKLCRLVKVPRALNETEVAQVNKALMNMVPQAQAKLN